MIVSPLHELQEVGIRMSSFETVAVLYIDVQYIGSILVLCSHFWTPLDQYWLYVCTESSRCKTVSYVHERNTSSEMFWKENNAGYFTLIWKFCHFTHIEGLNDRNLIIIEILLFWFLTYCRGNLQRIENKLVSKKLRK